MDESLRVILFGRVSLGIYISPWPYLAGFHTFTVHNCGVLLFLLNQTKKVNDKDGLISNACMKTIVDKKDPIPVIQCCSFKNQQSHICVVNWHFSRPLDSYLPLLRASQCNEALHDFVPKGVSQIGQVKVVSSTFNK